MRYDMIQVWSTIGEAAHLLDNGCRNAVLDGEHLVNETRTRFTEIQNQYKRDYHVFNSRKVSITCSPVLLFISSFFFFHFFFCSYKTIRFGFENNMDRFRKSLRVKTFISHRYKSTPARVVHVLLFEQQRNTITINNNVLLCYYYTFAFFCRKIVRRNRVEIRKIVVKFAVQMDSRIRHVAFWN